MDLEDSFRVDIVEWNRVVGVLILISNLYRVGFCDVFILWKLLGLLDRDDGDY